MIKHHIYQFICHRWFKFKEYHRCRIRFKFCGSWFWKLRV